MRVFLKKIFLLMLGFCCFVASAQAADSTALAQENGVLENAQVVFLFVSGIIFFFQSFSAGRLTRLLLWMAGWLCLSFILRELDVDKLPVPSWVVLIGSGMGRNLIMAAGWGFLAVLVIKSFSDLKGNLWVVFKSKTAILGMVACAFLVFGAIFEELKFQLLEESSEALGYFLLIPSAFFSKSILRD